MTTEFTGFRARDRSIARFVTRLPFLLSKNLWVWPLLGVLVLVVVGLWVHSRVEGATRAELASRLRTLLNADVTALRLWFNEQESDAKSFSTDARIEAAILELARAAWASNTTPQMLVDSPAATALAQHMGSVVASHRYLDYVVISTNRMILASPHPRLVGHAAPRAYEVFLNRAFTGRLTVSRPFARERTITQRAEGPEMFVAAPVRATNDAIIAVMALRLRPEADFTRIFSVARMGDSGEGYAFDRRGMMLTASRFDYELKRLGLVPNSPQATSILTVRLLDPLVELEPGDHPIKLRRDLHLTRMAAAAVSGEDGVDVDGYRNYRGVKVVGAWTWLPEYGMGVATEVSTQEAFETLNLLQQAFLVLFLLLVLCALAIFAFTLLVERLEASVRRSALAARRLGQYVLVQEIGRGSNGMVYRGRHALLRRPVAVKLLSPELTNESTARRFEHEVQMTSQLTHPNTVSIYDYGRTPEGLFYYAMEYLSGIDLSHLARQFGPQPERRVVQILRQVCGSLAEAHRIGLIHRDIKPANIVLTRRGGVCDFVKVLDFGLVKTVHAGPAEGTSAKAVVGTPHFMAPEAVKNPSQVDSRGDIYAVGAVGYWLLTGKTLFDTDEVDELLECQVKEMPATPSERLGRAVSCELEQLLMRCLAKDPAQRPGKADELAEALAQCHLNGSWSDLEAEIWWNTNLATVEAMPAATMAEKTLVIAPRA